MTLKTQGQLVEAAQNGDLESFGCLYEKYYAPMTALAYSVLRDRHLAEDAAQQSFVIACDNLAKLKSKDKFAPWLAAICRNTARQMNRTRAKTTALYDEQTADKQNTNGEAIRQAVWQLRPFDREPIVLRYYDNMTYDRIAELLGISKQAVHGRLTRAKRKIKKKLKQNGFRSYDHE
ncbi:RNA polymerase sigma factor [Planctomycetota bacterium]